MSKKDEALGLALEALAMKFSEGWHEGIKIDASDIMLLNDAAQALAEQPAQHDPSAGTQVSKVCWDGEKLMAKQVPLEDFYKPAQQEPVAWAHKHINATLAAFGPGEAISMTKETWAKLREAMSVLIEQTPQQEPVAWMCYPFGDDEVEFGPYEECENCIPLYTSPPVSKPCAWQPIETAPKDGTEILVCADVGLMVSFYHAGMWREKANMLGLRNKPTRWMPLPASPGIKENT